MAEYTVKDNQTGREITFDWNDPNPPTDKDMVAVFAEANRMTRTETKIMSPEPPTPEWAGQYPNLYGMYGAGRELYKQIGKPLIEGAGMVGGGAIGAISGFMGGAGLGAIPGTVLGAGLGYAGARNLTGAIDQYLDIGRGLDEPTPGRVMKSTAQDFVLGALGGGPTKGVTPVLPRQIAPEISSAMKQSGVKLSPAEITGGKTLAQVESLIEKVPFSSDIMQQWREKEQLKPLIALRNKYLETGLENTPRGEVLGQQIKEAIDKRLSQFDQSKLGAVDSLRDNILQQLGSKESYEGLSKEAQKIISSKSLAAVQKKNELYKAVSEVMPEGELPFSNYQQEATRQFDELSKLPNVDSKLKSTLRWGSNVEPNPAEQKLLEEIAAYPPEKRAQIITELGLSEPGVVVKDWATMQNHRNQLNELIRANDQSIKMNAPGLKGQLTDEGRRYKLLRDSLDKDFAQIAQDKGGDVLERWNVANAFYSDEYAPVWKQKTIRDMAYKRPADLVDVAVKPGSTMEVNLARKALGDEGFNKTIKPAFTNKLLGAGRDEPFNPTRLMKDLNNYGDETLLKVYTPWELDSLRTIAKTGQIYLEKEFPNLSILKTIAANTPNTVMDSILGSIERLPNSKSVLRNVTILNDFLNPQQKEGIKLELLDKVFRLNKTTDQVEPGSMAKNIQTYRRALDKYFSANEIKSLDNISTLGKIMTRAQQLAANPSGTAQSGIEWGAANQVIFNPVTPLIHGDFAEAGKRFAGGIVTAVLGPKALAKLYLSESGRKLLVKGMTTPKFTREGIDIAKKISIILGNEYLSDQ